MSVVAKRYADALFQLANEKNIVEQLISELKEVKKVFENEDKLYEFLNHPRVAKADKVKLIDDSFNKCDVNIVNLLKILVERHRIEQVPAIVDIFVELYNEANETATATVYSVRELSDAEKTEIEESFKKKLNKKSVAINNIVDPSIIGGLKIRVGNTIYDGSISGKLNRMRNRLVSESI